MPDVRAMLASGKTFLTFGGVETFLLFQQGFPLREFSAFEIFENPEAWKTFQKELLRPTANAALEHGHGLLADCLLWRAAPDYIQKLGYDENFLTTLHRKAVEETRAFVAGWAAEADPTGSCPVVVAAEIGPRGDGYALGEGEAVKVEDASGYHRRQIEVLAATDVDLLVAWTMTSVSEASGIALAARECGVPILLSATVETDGRLPDGTTLGQFVDAVDRETDGYPIFYLCNCAHPTHLAPALAAAAGKREKWLERFRGFRANASAKSHEDLDNSTGLDRGDPRALAAAMGELSRTYDLVVVGGCCGTDAEHIAAIAKACSRRQHPQLAESGGSDGKLGDGGVAHLHWPRGSSTQ